MEDSSLGAGIAIILCFLVIPIISELFGGYILRFVYKFLKK
jgi:hypothetical protein